MGLRPTAGSENPRPRRPRESGGRRQRIPAFALRPKAFGRRVAGMTRMERFWGGGGRMRTLLREDRESLLLASLFNARVFR
jgi:hypothetical protein